MPERSTDLTLRIRCVRFLVRGMTQAIVAGALLTTDPEDVLAEVIDEENADVVPNPQGQTLIPGGLFGPIPMGEDDDDGAE